MARLSPTAQPQRELHYLMRFAAVGVIGAVIDIALFALLHGALGLALLPANTISYSAGIVNNFLLNRRWTYHDAPQKAIRTQMIQFALVSVSALLLNNLLVALLTPLSASATGPQGGYLLAKACATAIGLVWNFGINRIWTFKHEMEYGHGCCSFGQQRRSGADGRRRRAALYLRQRRSSGLRRLRHVGVGREQLRSRARLRDYDAGRWDAGRRRPGGFGRGTQIALYDCGC
jgi:dolichol-phosphate mannosyltransferase